MRNSDAVSDATGRIMFIHVVALTQTGVTGRATAVNLGLPTTLSPLSLPPTLPPHLPYGIAACFLSVPATSFSISSSYLLTS